MKYKIDIFIKKGEEFYPKEMQYYGSILCESDLSTDAMMYFLMHFENGVGIEGLEVKTYDLQEYCIVKINDYVGNGVHYKDKIHGNKEIQIVNQQDFIVDVPYLGVEEYMIFGDIAIEGYHDIDEINKIVKDAKSIVKSKSVLEWGASGQWDAYFIGLAASATVYVFDKLIALGFAPNNIKKANLPEKVKRKIAKEYNIDPMSLFMESFRTDEKGKEHMVFRSLSHRFKIVLDKGKLIKLEANKLNKYI